jgi:hypothetical protein
MVSYLLTGPRDRDLEVLLTIRPSSAWGVDTQS